MLHARKLTWVLALCVLAPLTFDCGVAGDGGGCDQPPGPSPVPSLIVNAGNDQTLEDANRDGREDVTLHGTASGGNITDWTWTAGSVELGKGDTITVSLPIGATQVTLMVQDDTGRKGSDTVAIAVHLPQPKVVGITARLDSTIQFGGTLLPVRLLTILDKQTLIAGQDVSVQFFSLDRPRVAILESSDGTTLCPVLVLASDETNGRVDVTLRRMALGFVALHPVLLQLSAADREKFFNQAASHPNVAFMEATIRNALASGANNLTDTTVYPELYSSIQQVVDDTLAAILPAPPASKRINADRQIQSDCGSVESGWSFSIEPGAAGNAVFVNPKNVFYGVDVNWPSGSHTVELVGPKGGIITFWPPKWPPWTDPNMECLALLQDSHNFTATAFGLSLNLATGEGQGTLANSLYAVALILDLIGAPIMLPAVVAESLTYGAALATGNAGSLPSWIQNLVLLLEDKLDQEIGVLVREVVKFVQDNWDEISYYVWQSRPGIGTANFVNKLGSLLGPLGAFLDLNDIAPFAFDAGWALGEGSLNFCLNNQSGNVTRYCKPLFSAKPDFTWSPPSASIGESVTFDPTPTLLDGNASTTFSWIFDDFDGSTSVDTSTAGKQNVQHAFSQPGLHRVTLRVSGDNRRFGVDKYVPVSLFPNLGFEANSFNLWTVETHTWGNTAPGSAASHSAIVTPGNDPIVGAAVTRVWSGKYALRIEDSGSGCFISSASRVVTVPAGGTLLKFAWAAVLEDPNHVPSKQPYFDIRVKNEDTGQDLYYIHHYSNEPGFPWGSAQGGQWKYTPWQPVEIDLTPYAGQRVRVSAIAADCGLCGHGGYVYLDAFEGQ